MIELPLITVAEGGDANVDVDIMLHTGRLTVDFTVLGESCGDAGASPVAAAAAQDAGPDVTESPQAAPSPAPGSAPEVTPERTGDVPAEGATFQATEEGGGSEPAASGPLDGIVQTRTPVPSATPGLIVSGVEELARGVDVPGQKLGMAEADGGHEQGEPPGQHQRARTVGKGINLHGAVRGIALVEGSLVEALLGVRMPRRPMFSSRCPPSS